MVGKTLTHYKILEELGRGGMGIVYKAEDTKLGRAVALKFLSSQLTDDPTAKERFIREARAAAILRHDAICAIHDIGEEEDGTMYIVMPYYEGETLKERIAQGSLSAELAVSVASQVASGLGAAHAQGLTHRDIKPANILLTEGDRVKVLDFGLAKLAGDVDLTLTSSTIGTMAYMSPEQVQNAPVDARSDLWSLGVVLYEMLTGEKPFTGNYDAAIVYGIVNQDLTFDHPKIPDNIRPVLEKLLDKEPGKRYPSAQELLGDFGGDEDLALATPTATKDPKATPAGFGMTRWVAIGGVLVLLLLAVIWVVSRNDSDSAASAEVVTASSGLPTVGVMYIENNTPRERLGFVLRDMLARNLGQVDSIQVISNQRLKDILRQEVGRETEVISASTATLVANQAGIQTMILGSIVQLGSQYVLEAELMDVETGNIIDAVSATAASESELMTAVNQLTEGILKGSGKMGVTESGLYQIQNVSTSSLSAYELYEKGVDEFEHWRYTQAEQSFLAAIAIDSTFVAPYIGAVEAASAFSFNPKADISEPREFIRKASRQLIHATDAERDELGLIKQRLEFSEMRVLEKEHQRLADKYPTEKQFQFSAGLFTSGQKKYEYFNRLFDLDPSYALGYNVLGYYQLSDGHLDEAVSTMRRYRSLQPDVSNTMDSAWEVMTGAGRTEEALSMLDQSLAGIIHAICLYG